MKLIVCSSKDPASYNMFKIFVENFNFKEKDENLYLYDDFSIFLIKDKLIYASYIDKKFPEAELVIFASKHSSKEKRPCLTVHSDGNWGKAELGGKDFKITIAPALYIKQALLKLYELRDIFNLKKYEVSLEVTHHGPNLDKPSLWVEVGSSEKEWDDLKACEIVCESIISLKKLEIKDNKVVVGFGGPHYAPNFTKLILTKNYAIGHIIPKYSLDYVPNRLIEEAYLKTTPKPEFGIIDWKGTKKEHREKIISVFEKNEWDLKKLKDL